MSLLPHIIWEADLQLHSAGKGSPRHGMFFLISAGGSFLDAVSLQTYIFEIHPGTLRLVPTAVSGL